MPSLEHYANNASTTLNGGIDASQVTITVASTGGFPAIPQFRILIDNEILLTTGVTGTTWAVARGYEGSTAASHSNGSAVHQVLTSGGLCSVGSQIIQVGAWADRPSPSSGTVGRMYVPTDGYTIAQDDGTQWKTFGPIFYFNPPTSALNNEMEWVNQGVGTSGATVTASGDAIYLHGVGNGNATMIRARVKNLTVTGNYRVTAYLESNVLSNKSTLGYGVCWRNAAAGTMIIFGIRAGITTVFKMATPTSENAVYSGLNAPLAAFIPARWFKMEEDGSTRYAYISQNGKQWFLFHSIANNDFLTADQVGIWVQTRNNAIPNIDVDLHLLHWKEEY